MDKMCQLHNKKCALRQEIQMMLWPQKSDCISECPTVPPAHSLPTYYLPPETQGLR